jgi:phosphatidylserine decarboxylase
VIRVIDRATGQEFTEQVYGEGFLRAAYGNVPGRLLADRILASRPLSAIYGRMQSRPASARKIPGFVAQFGINLDEYEPGPFASFNEFFVRRFREGRRSFATVGLAAPAEGRYLAWKAIREDDLFPVKGRYLSGESLLGERSAEWGGFFRGGPLLLARLCPVDYHRFHFPADGRVLDHYTVHGRYHSVNPVALRAFPEVFATNERQVTILETPDLGKLAYLEVGAMCVGKIVQRSPWAPGQIFSRGEEKGYFLFGASTVIVLGQAGRWSPAADLLTHTDMKLETLVRLGERVCG